MRSGIAWVRRAQPARQLYNVQSDTAKNVALSENGLELLLCKALKQNCGCAATDGRG